MTGATSILSRLRTDLEAEVRRRAGSSLSASTSRTAPRASRQDASDGSIIDVTELSRHAGASCGCGRGNHRLFKLGVRLRADAQTAVHLRHRPRSVRPGPRVLLSADGNAVLHFTNTDELSENILAFDDGAYQARIDDFLAKKGVRRRRSRERTYSWSYQASD